MGEYADIIQLFIDAGFTIVTIAGILFLFGTLHLWKEFKEPKSKLVNISFGISSILSGAIAVTSYYGNHFNHQDFITTSNYLLIIGIFYLPCCVAIGICNEHLQNLFEWLYEKIAFKRYPLELSLEDLVIEEDLSTEDEEESEDPDVIY